MSEPHIPNAVPEPGGENMDAKVRKAAQPPRTASGEVSDTGTGVSGTEIPRADPGPGHRVNVEDRRPTQLGGSGLNVNSDAGQGSTEPGASADSADSRLDLFPPEEGADRINPGTDPYDTSEGRMHRDTVPAPNADATDPSGGGSSATRVTTRPDKQGR